MFYPKHPFVFLKYNQCGCILHDLVLHLGVIVDLDTSFRVNVLGADYLTVPLQRLQLEELGRGQKLQKKSEASLASSLVLDCENHEWVTCSFQIIALQCKDLCVNGNVCDGDLTSIMSVFLMCRASVPPKQRYCITSCEEEIHVSFRLRMTAVQTHASKSVTVRFKHNSKVPLVYNICIT